MTISFLPYKGLCSQHWFIKKQIIGNDEGMTFCVWINDKKYQLIVCDNYYLKIQQIEIENNMEQEGRNLDDSLKAMFVILHNLKKRSFVNASNIYSRWLNYKSL